jgi:phosphoglycolate phosphatase
MARVIFDLDGTLVDSAASLTAATNALLSELGRAPLSSATAQGFVGHGVAVLVRRMLDHTGGIPEPGLEACVARFRTIYAADPVTGTTTFPGVPEALAALAAEGHGLGVCTQKPHLPARRLLQDLGLMPPIAALTDGDSLGVMKPDPRMLAHTAAQLPVGPVIFVGDSGVDSATAEAAGVPFLLHTEGYPGEGSLRNVGSFAHFSELPALVERLLGIAAPA